PVDHILRPRLPWRSDEQMITECGYNPASVKTLTREQYLQRKKELGAQRCAMLTCMTCAQTADRWGAGWSDDPRLALAREIEWERGGHYYMAREDRGQRLKDELLAIADLIVAHKEEFDTAVQTAVARREWNDRKASVGRRDA